MRRLYTLIILMCIMQCYAMENHTLVLSAETPLKKKKIMTDAKYEISVPDIIEKICSALEQKNIHQAEWWYARLHKKMYIDWQFLNEEQITAFADLNYNIYLRIDSMQPSKTKKLPPQPHQNTYERQALTWIRQAIEADADTSLVWRTALDGTQDNKPIPPPQSLKKHRLEQLNKLEGIQ